MTTLLSTLKVIDRPKIEAKPPILGKRMKLIDRLEEQLAMVKAMLNKTPFEAFREKSVKDPETGERKNRPLKQIRCSDVLSKYVGESEQKVARIFEEAAAEQQILLLDEVDSLLTSRDRLRSQHELQLVNELLTQLESFDQPLFAATNYDTLLDRAVMRRFDFKLHCDYLTAEQVKTLYKRTLSVRTMSDDELSALTVLKQLTPGDFAILARRLKFCEASKSNLRDMAIGLLREENQRKQPPQAIGFIK